METIAFLGCSRGLGRAVALAWAKEFPLQESIIVARKSELLKDLSIEMKSPTVIKTCDFSKSDHVDDLLRYLDDVQPERVFYFAAGGPYGQFSEKKWKDHKWALQVSLLTPAEILHHLITNDSRLQQFVAVGSTVADSKADPMASTYASAKHGLRGLFESLGGEDLGIDIRLFRPGYMDTGLLPAQSKPRRDGEPLLDPTYAAREFVKWAADPSGSKSLSLEAPG